MGRFERARLKPCLFKTRDAGFHRPATLAKTDTSAKDAYRAASSAASIELGDFGPQDRVEFSSSEFHCAKTAHLYSNCGDAETHRSICRLSEEKPESDSTHGWRQESFAWLKTRHGVAGSLRCLLIVTSGGPLLSLGSHPIPFSGARFQGLPGAAHGLLLHIAPVIPWPSVMV